MNIIKKIIQEEFENNINYSYDDINKFIDESNNILNIVRKQYLIKEEMVLDVNVREIIENISNYEQLLTHLNDTKEKVEDKYNKFYNIVELYEKQYENNELYNKLKILEKNTDELSDYVDKFNNLSFFLDSIITNKPF